MVYIWQSAEDYPQSSIAEYDRLTSPDRFIFKEGKIVSVDKKPNFKVGKKINEIRKMDHVCNQTLVPLVSSRLSNCLINYFSKDIQLFKANIICIDGLIDDYFLVNVTHCVHAINHEKSKCKYDEDNWLWGFDHLEYFPDCLGEYDIARDIEYHGNLIVSERVKELFEENNFTGYGLYSPNETI